MMAPAKVARAGLKNIGRRGHVIVGAPNKVMDFMGKHFMHGLSTRECTGAYSMARSTKRSTPGLATRSRPAALRRHAKDPPLLR